jgi:hypothetical protein
MKRIAMWIAVLASCGSVEQSEIDGPADPDDRTVKVSLMGTGAGTIVSEPDVLSCPGACTATIPEGTQLTLTALPDDASVFGGWGGACVGLQRCTVTATAHTTISATFQLGTRLSVTRTGEGMGTVTSNPPGISCGVDCGEAVLPGTLVELTATAASGTTFVGWSGGACTGRGTCSLIVNASQSVTAEFARISYSVDVMKMGTATGTVRSVPAGIDCGGDCSESYPFGTQITLIATPNAGAYFAGWGGLACTGTRDCTLTVNGSTAVTARFNFIP